jgi:hypothetical protein
VGQGVLAKRQETGAAPLLAASTASTAATEPAEHESHGVRGQHQLFG